MSGYDVYSPMTYHVKNWFRVLVMLVHVHVLRKVDIHITFNIFTSEVEHTFNLPLDTKHSAIIYRRHPFKGN